MESLKIIANAYVITCDAQNRGGRYNLLIRNGRIAEVSDRLDLFTSLHPYATVIDASNKLIIPGFVNAHFHSESLLLRARTDGLHYALWKNDLRFQECVQGLLDPLNHDDLRNLYLMSYFSHLKSGTTTVAEFSLPLNDKAFVHMLHAIERTEVRSVVALQNWDQITKAREPGSGRHRFVLNVGREEDFNVYGFENLIRSARGLKVPMLAHVAEQRADVELVRRNFQKTILGVLQDYTVVSPETVFVHLNHLSSSEVEVLADCGATAVVCAWSGALKRTGYPALRHLAAQRIRLAIGTDWANVDMLGELKFLQQLHLLISSISPFSPLQLVRMATVNGAHALGLSHETGSIEAGKKADLTFFSLADMRLPVISEFADAESLASLLINHLNTRDVTDVMIDGEFYVAQGHVMTMAEEEVVDEFRKTYAKYYEDEAKKIPPPPLPAIEESPTRAKHKVLPFVAQGRAAQPLEEGFESGFQPVEKPPTVIEIRTSNVNVEPPTQTPPATIKESPRPRQEPSKGAWRTFGDDEEF